MRKKRQKTDRKNLRGIKAIVTAQTKWHLDKICAYKGWGEKDIGRAIDLVTRIYCEQAFGSGDIRHNSD